MFDPSKLDLDLENKDEVKKSENENNIDNQKKLVEKEEPLEEQDILGSLNVSENKGNYTLQNLGELQNSGKSKKTEEEFTSIVKNEEINIIEPEILQNKGNTVIKSEKREDIETKNIKTESDKKETTEIKVNTIKSSEIKKSNAENSENINKNLETKKDNIIYDINLNSVDILLSILTEKQYDYVTFEPEDLAVKVTFRKDKIEKEIKYIKFPIYSNILLKIKALTKLVIEETDKEQEGAGEKIIKNNNYKIISKVVPSQSGAKLFIKAIPIQKKAGKKVGKKTSLNQIITFLGAISFITLIIGAAFIGFIALNAKTIEDVKFFYSLGINLNDINNFIGQALSVVFSILIFIETIFLVTFLFKFSLTKKEFKQKKIRYGILSSILLIITFSTASAWMIIDQKIKSLPNWQEVAYGDIQIYDNSKLLSDSFNKKSSIIQDYSNLIGPIQVKFDLSFFAKKEEQKGMSIKKYIWDFGNGEIIETPNSSIIYNFTEKGNYEVTLTVEEMDLKGTIIKKEVENIPSINVSYIVKVNEKKLKSGGKFVDFDASSLKELGKIEWYFTEDLTKPIWSNYIFIIGEPIFKERIVGMSIKRNDKKTTTIDKVFIISGEDETNIDGKISYKKSILNDLEYEIKVDNLKNDFGKGYIEEFKWLIGDKETTQESDAIDPTKASKIVHIFPSYGEHKIKVTLKNSAGEIKELFTVIDIPKNLKLSKPLRIFNNKEILKDIQYDKNLNEYYINEIGTPTTLKLDARFIRADSNIYSLKKVDWDYNSDGDIDESTKTGKYNIDIEGSHKITVHYTFVNKRINDDIIKIKEQIFIEGLKKEAIIDFDIIQKSNYVPVVISFDASKSQVKNENIVKFIWDYGDGVVEERDSIVPGHKYSIKGNYEVKLTVVTTSGKKYSTSKKLILLPKPQNIKITASLKKAEILQGIDFTSEKSEGQITGYFWDFGDGNISTEANPTHFYKKPGNYTVTLKLDFSNNNVLDSTMKILIYE